MPTKLPRQLPWRDFVRVLKELGYQLHRSGGGSARTFAHPTRSPRFVTFHEPHDPPTIPPGTLRSYVRRLDLDLKVFLDMLG